jgi:hypothetical protein
MKKKVGFRVALVSGMLLGFLCGHVQANTDGGRSAGEAITAAEVAIEEARAAIDNGKSLVNQIPADSMFAGEVMDMLSAAAANWDVAVDSLDAARASASKIQAAASEDIANDYKILATVSSDVALSGANVVKASLLFVEAAANNKTESLDLIRLAVQDSLAAASQVQFNYERVKAFIAEKYSN